MADLLPPKRDSAGAGLVGSLRSTAGRDRGPVAVAVGSRDLSAAAAALAGLGDERRRLGPGLGRADQAPGGVGIDRRAQDQGDHRLRCGKPWTPWAPSTTLEELSGADHHRIRLTLRNSAELQLHGVSQIVPTVEQVKRASVHYVLTIAASTAGAVQVAARAAGFVFPEPLRLKIDARLALSFQLGIGVGLLGAASPEAAMGSVVGVDRRHSGSAYHHPGAAEPDRRH